MGRGVLGRRRGTGADPLPFGRRHDALIHQGIEGLVKAQGRGDRLGLWLEPGAGALGGGGLAWGRLVGGGALEFNRSCRGWAVGLVGPIPLSQHRQHGGDNWRSGQEGRAQGQDVGPGTAGGLGGRHQHGPIVKINGPCAQN